MGDGPVWGRLRPQRNSCRRNLMYQSVWTPGKHDLQGIYGTSSEDEANDMTFRAVCNQCDRRSKEVRIGPWDISREQRYRMRDGEVEALKATLVFFGGAA